MKQPWEVEDDLLDDIYLGSLASVAVVLLIVMACCALLVLAYALAQPWVNEIISAWEFNP